MGAFYDVINNDKLIQTDLTRREVQELFDIDRSMLSRICDMGYVFMNQYAVVMSEPDDPISDELANEWDTYIKKFRRRHKNANNGIC